MWKKKPTFPEILFTISLFLLLLPLGRALYEYARLAGTALSFPFPLDYGEGPVLDQTLRLAHFENIYRSDLTTPPFTISNYPPLFHLLQAPFALIFGPAFWYGRLLSISSALAAVVLVGLILHAVTGDWMASATGGLILLSFPYVMQWSVFNRVDTLALALSLGGLYAILRWPDRRRGWLVAGLLFTTAVFTRQSYALTAPLAAFAWLWQLKQKRQAIRLAAFTAGSCLGWFLLLNLLTRGGFFLNVVTANLNPLSFYTVIKYGIDIYLNAAYLIIGGVLFIIAEPLGMRTRSWPLATPYFVGAVVAAFTVGKAGSSVNYLFEVAVALSLFAGAIIAWTGNSYGFKALVIFLLAFQMFGIVNWSRQEYIPFVTGKVDNYREVAQLAELVRKAPGPVLADEYMGLLPLYGRRLYFQPFEFKQLAEAHLWNQDLFLASIQREEFSAILIYEPRSGNGRITRWTPEIRNTIYAHYELDKILAETFIYLPKGFAAPP